MEQSPFLLENLRDPVKFVELLAPELGRHLPQWQVELIRVMVERGVKFVPPVPSPRPSRPAFELWMQAKADPMVLQLLPPEQLIRPDR